MGAGQINLDLNDLSQSVCFSRFVDIESPCQISALRLSFLLEHFNHGIPFNGG